jgi:hypothetical protein
MVPVKPIEGREWAALGGCEKKLSISASGVTLKYSPEVPEPTITSCAVISPRMSILEAYPPIPLSVVANWSAKMRTTLGPEINIAFRVGQTNAM